MRGRRSRLALLGILALGLSVAVGPGAAGAATVSKTASGGLVPDATFDGTKETQTAFVQSFKLGGAKVTKKQVLDVNVTVNSTGSGAGANAQLRSKLVGPKGANGSLGLPGLGQSMLNLEFDDQSDLGPCNPITFQASDCNYLQGGNALGTTGTMTGELNTFLNPLFKGGNPKGTWKLFVWDVDPLVTTTLGATKLEVKTGKKFAKE